MDATADPAVRVNVRRKPAAADELQRDLDRLRRFSTFMDSQFEVAGIKFGADALAGLIPGIGDAATTAAGLYPIYLARKHELGKRVIGKMLANLAVDFGVGLVPFLGDAADVWFKASLKNRAVFEKAVAKRTPRPPAPAA
jgi:hypothetical protein